VKSFIIGIFYFVFYLSGYCQQQLSPIEYKVKNNRIPIQNSPLGEIIIKVPINKKLTVLSFNVEGNYYVVKYNDYSGIVKELWLSDIDQQMRNAAIKHFNDSIQNAINVEKERKKQEMLRLNPVPNIGDTLYCVTTVPIYKDDYPAMSELCKIQGGQYVIYQDVLGDKFQIFKVKYDNNIGITYRDNLRNSKEYAAYKKELAKREEQRIAGEKTEEKAKKAAETKSKNDLIKKYGQTKGKLVYEKKIALGMTKEMVIDSWGEPKDINRTVGSWGIHEQWVYGSAYLYFENGILTSWQD
jgi:hypothetical protein